MVKVVTKFHKHHLGGRVKLECVCVLGRISSFGRKGGGGGGELQCSVLTWRECIAHNN